MLNRIKTTRLSAVFNIRKVLVAPLDWGLGHATRCIPVIKELVHNGYDVLIAAEGAQAALLKQEFPQLTILQLKGYRVRYSKRKWWLPVTLLLQMPHIWNAIRYEHRWLQRIIDEENIDLVIADNRYGLYTKKVHCVFITHQLTIRMPFAWLEKLVQRINYGFINRFTVCWVPDMAGSENAAGLLSHPEKWPGVPVYYTGLLSRFQKKQEIKKYDYFFLLSGPEPQRTIFEKKILALLPELNGEILLVRGKPGDHEQSMNRHGLTVMNHLSTTDMQAALQQSNCIICRSGYTTVMELLSLQGKAILVPTPGQTEQEYLAWYLRQQGWCGAVTQQDFTAEQVMEFPVSLCTQPPALKIFDQEMLCSLINALEKTSL